MSPTSIVAYLVLFALVGFLFIFAALVMGRFLRAFAPTPGKREVYECGEPAIGTSYVQFDLRFYVVALLFIIFDVEVAFFFPWATVFGKATQLTDLTDRGMAVVAAGDSGGVELTPEAAAKLSELGVPRPSVPEPAADEAENTAGLQASARRLALTALADISVFFGVLMIGFAYVWYRGDLDWVRAVGMEASAEPEESEAPSEVVEV